MNSHLRQYRQMMKESDINVLYCGPLWADGIDGLAEMLLKRLEFDDLPKNSSQSVFSIFVEQMNNMMMYSAEKGHDDGHVSAPFGCFILGVQDKAYFVQTENVVTDSNAEILKARIDHLNTLDKKELRQYHKRQMSAVNDNPESKGAGIGLIEIARRATGPITYGFEPYSDGLQYFTLYVKVERNGEAA